MKLAPSIFAADITNLKEIITELENNNVDMIHVDIMDGHFVEGMAFGPDHLKMIKQRTTIPLDVHLMVQSPERMIDRVIVAGADAVSVHYEGNDQILSSIKRIKDQGIKAGVVLSPGTSPEAICYLLEDIDFVLIMMVNPGKPNQSFLPLMLDKICHLKKLIGGRPIDIEVDGSIDDAQAKASIQRGATIIVSGSYLFKGDLSANITTLKNVLKKEEGEL